MAPQAPPEKLPSIETLGRDLLLVTRWERCLAILRPTVCASLYFVFAARGWWIPAVCCVAGLMFITYVSTSHDLLHPTLGFSRWQNEFWLCVIELLALRSGHAFRISHLCHHRHFPEPEDVEGRAAHMPLWRALLEGIGKQTRLYFWAFPRARRDEKVWMLLEGGLSLGAVIASIAYCSYSYVPLIYVLLIVVSSWLYPVATVWVPHNAEAEAILFQTRALRGRLVPELFLQHTYHLEHHLYPSVPSFNWWKLAKRLDPYLRAHGVKPFETL